MGVLTALVLSVPPVALLAIVPLVIAAVWIYLQRQHHSHLPRGYSHAKFLSDEQMPTHATEVHRDVYSQQKIPKDIDAIVIGSGIGGLSCAGLLSRAGKRVLVLEQHYIAGGSTHAFEEAGYEFDTGVHYIGNIHKRQKYFDLILETPIEWDEMGLLPWDIKRSYDELRIGDRSYFLAAGRKAFVDEMVSHFPEERETVERWLDLCEKVSQKGLFFNLKVVRPVWLGKVINLFSSSDFFKYANKTALEVAQDLTPNKELQAALLGQFGDYGKLPSVESFFLHASVANHYLNGGFYPRGGSAVIAKGAVPVIERTGGRVLVRAKVEEILVENGRCVGVRMAKGEEIRAPSIISGCGVFNTYKRLLPPQAVPPSIIDKIEDIGPSCSMVYLFVGMEGTPSELQLRSSNIWHWPGSDYDRLLEEFYNDPEHAPLPAFIGFPCAKDSTWETRYPGRSNAVILTMCKYEWWEAWEGTKQGKRGDDYDAKKKMFEERILEDALYQYYPQCRGRVKHTSVGTSLSFNHYIGSERGEVYGMESSPARFQKDDWLRPQTRIPGLFLTGQDVTTLGVTGALLAGVLTAHAVLGYGGIVDMISGRNLVEDIWHLDADKGASKLAAAANTKKIE